MAKCVLPLRALPLLALLPIAANASDFSAAALTKCLDEGGSSACIGLGVSSCQSQTDPAANRACFTAALTWWDTRRNTTLAALTAAVAPDYAAQLTTLNSNWQAYAASMCQDVSARYTGFPESCQLQQLANFTTTLDAILEREQ